MVVTPNPYGVGLNLYRHLNGSKHARLSARSHALPHSCRASPPRHLLPSPCRGSAWLSSTEGALYLSHLDGDINLAPSVRMGNVHGSTPLYRTRPMGGWLASHIHLSLGVVTVIAYGTAMICDLHHEPEETGGTNKGTLPGTRGRVAENTGEAPTSDAPPVICCSPTCKNTAWRKRAASGALFQVA